MRAKARASTVRHNWLAAISTPQTTIDAAVISVHITAQRISAPSPIAIVVRCARSYSVATWSTCARSISAGGIAASGESANTFAASMRVGRQRVDDGAAARQLGDRLCAGAHVERLEDRTDVHLHRTFRQPKVATDQLVGLALYEQPKNIGLPVREPERLPGEAPDRRRERREVRRHAPAASQHRAHGV